MKEEGATLTLATTEKERDLGVIISSNLKPSAQWLKGANKAMSVLVKRNFRTLNMDSFNNNNNNNNHDNVYGAIIMAESLREFTRFI